MAGSISLGSFDDNKVRFELDYDDSLVALTFRCVNESTDNAYGLVKRIDPDTGTVDGNQWGDVCPAGETKVIAIPQSANKRIVLIPHPSKPGKFGGFEADTRYPF